MVVLQDYGTAPVAHDPACVRMETPTTNDTVGPHSTYSPMLWGSSLILIADARSTSHMHLSYTLAGVTDPKEIFVICGTTYIKHWPSAHGSTTAFRSRGAYRDRPLKTSE